MAIMWHGGSRWEGAPEIRPAKRGRAEWGPGVYGTTSYFRASRYAKGGKVVQLVEFAPRLLLGRAAIGLDTLTSFVKQNAPGSKRGDILERLQGAAARNKIEGLALLGDGQMVRADVIVNMWVNTDLSSGVRGPKLSQFLVELGIDAACDGASSLDGTPEAWTVVFNPDAITRHEVYATKDVDDSMWTLPDPRVEPGVTMSQFLSRGRDCDCGDEKLERPHDVRARPGA